MIEKPGNDCENGAEQGSNVLKSGVTSGKNSNGKEETQIQSPENGDTRVISEHVIEGVENGSNKCHEKNNCNGENCKETGDDVKSLTLSKMCPQEVPNDRSKFPENNNCNGDITKDTEPVAEQGESEHVGKSGTVTEIVPLVVEKASSQYTDNTDGNPEIPKEGELVGKSRTKTETVPPVVDKASSKSAENTNGRTEIHKADQVGKSGTATKTVPPCVDDASINSNKNSNGNTEILKEGETLVNWALQ